MNDGLSLGTELSTMKVDARGLTPKWIQKSSTLRKYSRALTEVTSPLPTKVRPAPDSFSVPQKDTVDGIGQYCKTYEKQNMAM